MVTTVGDGGYVRPIEQRLMEGLRLPPLGLWIVATLVVIVVCTVWHNVTGPWRGIDHALVNAMLPSGHPALEDVPWRAIRDVAIWVFSMRLIFFVIGSSWRVSQLVEHTARIDLFDLRDLAPVVRIGLRNALAFAAGVSMLAGMAGDEVTLPVTLSTMAVVGIVGAFALLLPVHGARRAIRVAKNAELSAVRAAIRRARTATFEGSAEGAREAMLLSGLLTLEARLAGVVEWPFNLGTFVRLFFFLTLPLASWIAAAVVERFVSYVLGWKCTSPDAPLMI